MDKYSNKSINMENSSSEYESVYSLNSYKKYDKDTIPFRLEFIKDILKGNKLKPMIRSDKLATEYFVHTTNEDMVDDKKSIDTRHVLNKKLYNFNKIIEQIGGELEYIKSGTTGHTFKGAIECKDGSEICYAVKIVAFPVHKIYGSMNDATRPENAELMMIKALSYFVVNELTPHIVLPIATFNTSIKPFLSLIEDGVVAKDNNNYLKFLEKHKEKKLHKYVSILISEWANRRDFLFFVRNNYRVFKLIHWKCFFFQILITLAIIHEKYPTFRHNDLKANNILINKLDAKRNKKLSIYTLAGKKYYVPGIGYQLKLWDFDFACIAGKIDNSKVNAEWCDKLNIKPEKNRYYDMHFFFNTLIKPGFFNNFMGSKRIPQEVKDFINRIIPKQYQDYKGKPGKNELDGIVSEKGRLLINDEYLTPKMVVENDKFFDLFRKKKEGKSRTYNKHKYSYNMQNKTNDKKYNSKSWKAPKSSEGIIFTKDGRVIF